MFPWFARYLLYMPHTRPSLVALVAVMFSYPHSTDNCSSLVCKHTLNSDSVTKFISLT